MVGFMSCFGEGKIRGGEQMVARGVVEVAEPSSTAAVGVRKKRGKGGFSSLVFVSSIDNEYLSYFWINMATLNKSKRYFLQIKIRSKS